MDPNMNGAVTNFHISPAVWAIYVVIVVVLIASIWRVFTKAGKPGWWAIIPIVNTFVLCKIGGKPGWWILLFLIPIANIVFLVLVYHGVSKAFGKSGAFTVGLIFLSFIFFPILGFGKARYQGNYGGVQPEFGYYPYPPQGPQPGQ